jgi:F0F1-type ATP synthase assembly protein I
MVWLCHESGSQFVLAHRRICYNFISMNQMGNKKQDEFRVAVTMTVVWVAGLTLIIIFVALFAGLLLDRLLNSKPLFTIVLTIASIPVTIFATYRVVKSASGRIQPIVKKENLEEEPNRGKDN